MADHPDIEEGILDLWPTKFMARRPDGSESWNQELGKLVRKLERDKKDQTTDYLAPGVFNMGHHAANRPRAGGTRAGGRRPMLTRMPDRALRSAGPSAVPSAASMT